jgi:hypothetical protein
VSSHSGAQVLRPLEPGVPAVLASRRGTGDLVSCREVGARGGAGRAAVVWRGKWNSAAAAAMASLPGKPRDGGGVRHCFWQGKASTTSRTRRGLPYGAARPAGLHERHLARARPRTGAWPCWAGMQAAPACWARCTASCTGDVPTVLLWSTATRSRRPYTGIVRYNAWQGETRGDAGAHWMAATSPAPAFGFIYPVSKMLNSKKCQLS